MKRRTVIFRKDDWVEWNGNADSTPPGPPSLFTASGNQDLLVSEGHKFYDLGNRDQGGPFHVVRRELAEVNFGPVHNRTVLASADDNPYAYNYKGNYYARRTNITDADFPVVSPSSNSELDAAGATAIANVIPTNPLAGAAVAIAELKREGIPSLLGAQTLRERALTARNAGSEYLNVEFGWKPLVNDVLALTDAIFNSDELVDKYVRESGKRLHRQYTFPEETTTSTEVVTGVTPAPQIKLGYWSGNGDLTVTTVTRQKRWFNGCFTYYLAPQGSFRRAEQIAAKRFGLRITPEVLWNLTPWSWAADWLSNVGDVFHNVSAFAADGLVMPYGYMMETKSVMKLYSHTGGVMKRTQTPVPDISQQFTTTVKSRRRATPFGFGLELDSFTDRQWAILTALGLSRGGKSL